MNVVFRVDASRLIGTGHVMRCLTLARALREAGESCRFICREDEGNLTARIREEKFEATKLNNTEVTLMTHVGIVSDQDYESWLGVSWQKDAAQTIEAIDDEEVDLLVVDHYGIDQRWEKALRPYVSKIMAVDDLANRHHDCDILLDQNLVANFQGRYDSLLPSICIRLLGPEFALLQPEYSILRLTAAPRTGPVERILISFGGADRANLTGLSISAFLKLGRSDIEVDVVIGNDSPQASQIAHYASLHPNIHIHHSLPTLAHLMLKSDLAIGAAGSTSWERCCLGLPSIVVTLAKNQRPIAKELERHDLVFWIGDSDTVTEREIIDALVSVIEQPSLEQWSRKCLSVTDSLGAQRVVSALTLSQNIEIKSRLSSYHDEQTLFGFVSSQFHANTNLNVDPATAEEHKTWLYSKLRDPESFRLFICETDTCLPLAKVCFELICDEWQISYSFAAYVYDARLRLRVLDDALHNFQSIRNESFMFSGLLEDESSWHKGFERIDLYSPKHPEKLSLAICSDKNSWVNAGLSELVLAWLGSGYTCQWVHDSEALSEGDLCFYLSYGKIVTKETLARYRNNLIVHASDLPKGRGWSPTSWMILEGENRIPVTLLEADEQVDAGAVYDQLWIDLDKSDLVAEWRSRLLAATKELVVGFVEKYPAQLTKLREQTGEASFYPRRKAKDSKLDPHRTIAEQFNLLRIVDNTHYPAFFELHGEEFVLEVRKRNRSTH